MSHEREQLKQRRLGALARQYERKGYRISVLPDRAARPDFLARFAPDLLAYGAAENVVVNLEFREDLIGNDVFVALAAAVEATPGWRFDLEIISPDELPVVGKEAAELDAGEIRERIAAARQLFAIGQEEAALLLIFTAVEATLRRLARGNAVDLDRPQVASLLSQLIWEGLIDREDYEFLRQALRYRNTIVHGYQTPEVQVTWPQAHRLGRSSFNTECRSRRHVICALSSRVSRCPLSLLLFPLPPRMLRWHTDSAKPRLIRYDVARRTLLHLEHASVRETWRLKAGINQRIAEGFQFCALASEGAIGRD